MRIPKDGFWSHQVVWDGWVDIERPRLHLLGHWDYDPGTKKDVVVVSSTDRVELFPITDTKLAPGEDGFVDPRDGKPAGTVRDIDAELGWLEISRRASRGGSRPRTTPPSGKTGLSPLPGSIWRNCSPRTPWVVT